MAYNADSAAIKRRKKMSANAGIASGVVGLAALGSKGLATDKAAKLFMVGPKGIHRANQLAVGLGTSSGVLAAGSGINSNLINRAELNNKAVAFKVLNNKTQAEKLVEGQIPKKRKVSKRDIRRRREWRNDNMPKYTAIGAGVAGAGAIGAGVTNRISGQKLKVARTDLDSTRSKIKTHEGKKEKRNAAATTEAEAKGRRDVIKNPNDIEWKRHNEDYKRNQGIRYRYDAKAKKLNASATSLGSQAKRLKNIHSVSGKSAIALGAGAGALGVTSAVMHRNNKTGASRHRKDWWNG
jgi:hypothetical protein